MTMTIEFEIEESILAELDGVAADIGVSREILITTAIKHALRFHRPKEFSAEDEVNTFRLWLAGNADAEDGSGIPDWDEDDARLN